MKLIVDDELKIAGFWLSRAERDDGELKASLKPQFAEWKAKNYLPVVYESGDGDLKESIYYLLKHHIEKKAKAEELSKQAAAGSESAKKKLKKLEKKFK